MFQFALQTANALRKAQYPQLALRLFLLSAVAADRCAMENVAYEYITQVPFWLVLTVVLCLTILQSFVAYEDHISESRSQVSALYLIAGTLESLVEMNEENLDTLSTKCVQHAARLLKKPDQARMVAAMAHLFWSCRPSETREKARDASCSLPAL